MILPFAKGNGGCLDYTIWSFLLAILKDVVEKVKAEIQKIEADSRARAKPRILIKKLLYPGTTLCVAGYKVRANKAFTGPLEAVLSDEKVVMRRVAQ